MLADRGVTIEPDLAFLSQVFDQRTAGTDEKEGSPKPDEETAELGSSQGISELTSLVHVLALPWVLSRPSAAKSIPSFSIRTWYCGKTLERRGRTEGRMTS